MSIKILVNNEEKYIVGLRRYFHANPEPSLKEYKTAVKIEEELKALGIPFERVGETGVVITMLSSFRPFAIKCKGTGAFLIVPKST